MVLCIPQYGISPVISKPTASGVMKDRAGMVEINLEWGPRVPMWRWYIGLVQGRRGPVI
jgi:hypothetical protein